MVTEQRKVRKRRLFLGLGSNLGDREANLKAALQALREHGVQVVRTSSLYESEPLGVSKPQPPYLNAVAEVITDMSLPDLLRVIESIERQLGRKEKGTGTPRPIDLDILWAEGERVCSPGLTVPHPRLWQRAFVLIPLSELVPDLDGICVIEAAQKVAQCQRVRLIRRRWFSIPEPRA